MRPPSPREFLWAYQTFLYPCPRWIYSYRIMYENIIIIIKTLVDASNKRIILTVQRLHTHIKTEYTYQLPLHPTYALITFFISSSPYRFPLRSLFKYIRHKTIYCFVFVRLRLYSLLANDNARPKYRSNIHTLLDTHYNLHNNVLRCR